MPQLRLALVSDLHGKRLALALAQVLCRIAMPWSKNTAATPKVRSFMRLV